MNEAEQLLRRVLEALREGFRPIIKIELTEEIRTYLANQETTAKDEPVAWRTFDGEQGYDYRSFEDNEGYKDEWIAMNGERYKNWVEPLYLHPQEPKKPMTVGEIADKWADSDACCYESFLEGSRFAEKHHGIGEEK